MMASGPTQSYKAFCPMRTFRPSKVSFYMSLCPSYDILENINNLKLYWVCCSSVSWLIITLVRSWETLDYDVVLIDLLYII